MADTAEPHETPGDVTPEDRLAAAALAYAERGYHVLPVEPNAKGPLTRHGYKDASTDTDQIKAWWTRWPDANIGLALSLSGLVAVDIDAYKDDCEWPTFAVGRDVPATLEQRSARGGTHLIFRAEPGARYRDKPCKGVDGKHQGYILAEPSAFEGGVYRFQNDMTPAQAPEWLKRPERTAAETFGNPNGTSGRSMAEVEEALSHISADVSYDDWYPVLMAIHHEFGDEGVSIADEWSARAPHRYKEGLVYEKFAGFGKSEVSQHAPVTAATLFKLAKEAGADLAALSHKHQAKRVIGLFEVIENPNAIPFPAKYDPDDTALATVFDQIAKRDRAPDVEDGEDVYPVQRISDIITRPSPVFLVKEFLPKEGVGILFGPSGSKKSFMAFDLAMSIVHEFKEWHGRRIKPAGDGSVIYIAGEGSSGLKPRIKAWLQARGVTDYQDEKLFVIDMAINFKDSKNIDRLIRTARSLSARPSLIIVDTLSQSMAGADENSQADASLFVNACGRLKRDLGGCVMAVHHPSKNDSKNMRGSGTFGNDVDFTLRMESARGSLEGVITVVKQKDGPENIAYPYRLIHHVLMDEPADEDGEIPSSLVFDHIGTDQIDKGKPDASAQGGPDQAPEVLKLMKADYDAGRGWLYANNVTDRTRRFRYIMARAFDIKADRAKEMVDGWVAEGIVTVETSPGQRAKVLVPQFVPVDPASVFDDVGVFG
ncbi:Primase C terminal 2 (PriCT-2) [Paracoccus alcaliphilus]|uniref:Primase C terminal 2 (PriCT-2) n=1 Tax=Paracoccus alcaliphilus TaxID=34002 RepID=A0A1H8GFE7_9RHOB|nr:bifunctional DNA primase/polymerase [Paracoccus alcaliphilus]WCR17994.1 AAA family ATPase [Paracoccus alcaliphilus]SEN42693.1 Primase C terminal 2 (PriCT-2) [Paracoccus alcaliphilus]